MKMKPKLFTQQRSMTNIDGDFHDEQKGATNSIPSPKDNCDDNYFRAGRLLTPLSCRRWKANWSSCSFVKNNGFERSVE